MSEMDYPENSISPMEEMHDKIMHAGFMARKSEISASANPFTKAACKEKSMPYDPEEEESWRRGWEYADQGISITIDGEKL